MKHLNQLVSQPSKRLHIFFYVLGGLGLLSAALYISQRIAFSAQTSHVALFNIVLGAEIFGFVVFALFWLDTSKLPVPTSSDILQGTVDVMITTYNEDVDILEATIVGALNLQNAEKIFVLDDGHRDWVQELAKHLGVEYVSREERTFAKAGNINHALNYSSSEFILLLDADHVPHPELIMRTIGYFKAPNVAIVQTPHDFRNADSFQHYGNNIHEQSLFYDVLMPARDRFNAVFWCGSAALLRRSALDEIGGVSHRSITEDFETSLDLMSRGYITKWHNEKLVSGLAPQSLDGYLVQRDRWARGTLSIIFSRKSPFLNRNLKFRAKLSYLGNLLYYFLAIQHLVYTCALTYTLMANKLVIAKPTWTLLSLWFATHVLLSISAWGLSQGRQTTLQGTKNSWLTATTYIHALFDLLRGVHQKFRVTPKNVNPRQNLASLKLLWLPTTMLVALCFAILIGYMHVFVFTESTSDLRVLNSSSYVLFLFFSIFELTALFAVVYRVLTRKQKRIFWRFPVNLSGRIGSYEMVVSDIHEHGVMLHLKDSNISNITVFDLEIFFNNGTTVSGTIISPRLVKKNSMIVSVAGLVEWNTPLDRRTVMKECYVPKGS